MTHDTEIHNTVDAYNRTLNTDYEQQRYRLENIYNLILMQISPII